MKRTLFLRVLRPHKSASLYGFECVARRDLSSPREVLGVAYTRLRHGAWTAKRTIRFGFRALNYELRHHELWDGFFPLLYLTRNSGPLFNTGYERATIRFDYPISEAIAALFTARAASMGLDVRIEADTTGRRFDAATEGHALAFGGGKESRLVLGVLRETGKAPLPVTGGRAHALDVPEARVVEPLSFDLASRIMPALMEMPRHFYIGSGLGEVQLHTPWQQHYDLSSQHGLAQLCSTLRSLGLELDAHGPTAMLPAALAQRILAERYPVLYAHQHSTPAQEASRKNLQIALSKLHHALPFSHHCSDTLFRKLLDAFVAGQLAAPHDFGFRDFNAPSSFEMRSIIARHLDHPLLSHLRGRVPNHWWSRWCDYIHPSAAACVPSDFLRIFSEHAQTADHATAGAATLPFPLADSSPMRG